MLVDLQIRYCRVVHYGFIPTWQWTYLPSGQLTQLWEQTILMGKSSLSSGEIPSPAGQIRIFSSQNHEVCFVLMRQSVFCWSSWILLHVIL